MKSISNHLVARGISHSIYYRRRIPTAILRAYPPKQKHIIECLFTSELATAVKLRKIIDVRIDAEFKQHERSLKQQQADRAKKRLDKLSEEQLESLANFWVRQVLLTDERRRNAGLDEDEFDEIGSQLQQQRSELGRMLAMGQSEKILPAMTAFIHLCGLDVELSPEETKRAGAVFLRAVVMGLEHQLQRQGGGVVLTQTVAPETLTPRQVADQSMAAKDTGPTWEKVFATWRDYVPGRKKATTIATQTAWLELKRLASAKGIEGPAGVTEELMREYVDNMALRLQVVTLNERLAKIKSLFKVVKGKGVLPTNPAADTLGLKENSHEKRKKKRLPFDEADLKTIFSSDVFNECQLRSRGQSAEATYWIPILMFYTGARTEELAGLALADVVQDPEFGWYFNLIDRPSVDDDLFDDDEYGDDDDDDDEEEQPKRQEISAPDDAVEEKEQTRLLKNGASIRKVPVAPELIELGLFRYMDWLRLKGHKSLFPSLEHDWHEKLSGAFSKFFGRYKRKVLGITNPKKVLYSFRHTMKDAMTSADVRSKYLKRTLGHGSGDGRTTDGYGNKDVPLGPLTAEFKKIKFSPIPAHPWEPGKGQVWYPKVVKKKKGT